jgi:hypothetical protein
MASLYTLNALFGQDVLRLTKAKRIHSIWEHETSRTGHRFQETSHQAVHLEILEPKSVDWGEKEFCDTKIVKFVP